MNKIEDNGEHDYEGKVTLGNFLIHSGFYDVQTTIKGSTWDMEACYKGNKYYFELKDRRKGRYKYLNTKGDSIIEDLKFNNLLKECPDIKRCYVVNIFLDGLTIFPVLSEHHLEDKVAGKTTFFANRERVPKTFVSYINRKSYIYDYGQSN